MPQTFNLMHSLTERVCYTSFLQDWSGTFWQRWLTVAGSRSALSPPVSCPWYRTWCGHTSLNPSAIQSSVYVRLTSITVPVDVWPVNEAFTFHRFRVIEEFLGRLPNFSDISHIVGESVSFDSFWPLQLNLWYPSSLIPAAVLKLLCLISAFSATLWLMYFFFFLTLVDWNKLELSKGHSMTVGCSHSLFTSSNPVPLSSELLDGTRY